MDEKVRSFLDKAKNEKLIAMGLIKETIKEYGPYGLKYSKYDPETKNYYRETPIPVDVTDEEFEKICKFAEMNHSKQQEENIDSKIAEIGAINNGAERILGLCNTIGIVFGIVAAVVCVLVGLFLDSEYSTLFIVYGILILIPFTLSWAALKVFLNISNNLHQINSKL